MIREPLAPLDGSFVSVDGLHVHQRTCERAGDAAAAVVHVHGFGISGSYVEPTAVRLAAIDGPDRPIERRERQLAPRGDRLRRASRGRR